MQMSRTTLNTNHILSYHTDILHSIFTHLSPKDKTTVAKVSRLFRIVAEDPFLLLRDFQNSKSLSSRQCFVLIEHSTTSSETKHSLISILHERLLRISKSPITENQLIALLTALEEHSFEKGLPIEKRAFYIFDTDKFGNILLLLAQLEKIFRLSKDFSFDKAVSIFLKFFDFLKSKSFDVNTPHLFPDALLPVSFFAIKLCPALLKTVCLSGADVNQPDDDEEMQGSTKRAIHYVSYDPNLDPNLTVETILTLKSLGADIDAQDLWGTTKLMEACEEGHTLSIQTLLKAGAKVNHFRPSPPSGIPCTPLQTAAREGHLEAVKTLIEYGADPTMVSQKLIFDHSHGRHVWKPVPMTAYDFAVSEKRKDVMAYLYGMR
jgi:hypothetical protein